MPHTVLDAAQQGYTALIRLKAGMDKTFANSKAVKDEFKKHCETMLTIIDKDLPYMKRILFGPNEGIPKLTSDVMRLEKDIEVLKAEARILSNRNEDLSRVNDKLTDYSKVTDKVEEMLTKWKQDLPDPTSSEVDITMKKEIKEAVKSNLKEVMTEAVNKIVNTEKMKKTFADVVNNSQNVIQKETKKCFKESLTSALQDSQNEIVARTTARQEADQLEKERRSRNVAISNIPESTATDNKAKIDADTHLVCELLQLQTDVFQEYFYTQ